MSYIKHFWELISRLYNHPVCDIIFSQELVTSITKTKKTVVFSDRILLMYLIVNKRWNLNPNQINSIHNTLIESNHNFFKNLVKPHIALEDMLWSGQFDKDGRIIWFTPTQHIWAHKNKKFVFKECESKEVKFIEEDSHISWIREKYFDDDTYDTKKSERSLGGKLDLFERENKSLLHYFVYLYLYNYYNNIAVWDRLLSAKKNKKLVTDQNQQFESWLMSKCTERFIKHKKEIHDSIIRLNEKKYSKPEILKNNSIETNIFLKKLWFHELDFFYPWSEYFINLWDSFVKEEILSTKEKKEREAKREEVKSQLWLDLDTEKIKKLKSFAKRILYIFGW